MTRLFIRFYLGVLIVLFAAWYIHGAVLKRRADAETARVIVTAHGGGARLVASELDAAPPASRAQALKALRGRFDYSIDIMALVDLPSSLQRRFSGAAVDVAYLRPAAGHCVVAALANGSEVVRLGPFPNYRLKEIEEAIAGWMRLTADKLGAATPGKRQAVLKRLQERFDFPVEIADRDDMPSAPKERVVGGADVVFFLGDLEVNDRWFAATPLADGTKVVVFGPFPSFERIEQKAATTTLALVLLPAALAIALLLRPIARQLRHVENAAKTFAAGDLSSRVDEPRVRSVKPLAEAFNHMASRTETLVRTQRELLQAVSHELRTPLSRMRFAIDLIETAKDDAERKQRLAALDTATEEIDELVRELLRYVRMETATLHLNREEVALRETLDVLIPKYAVLYPAIDFSVHDEGAEDNNIVSADRLGLQRVLSNLLSNAGRFAKSKVAIRAVATDAMTTIDVDDDGSGIPKSDRAGVFEPFVRLDDGRNDSGRGVGLGLALVKRIVTQHGGSAAILTSPLGGCRVRTTWPRETVSPQSTS
jgi:two-component system sensor histidine kinase RstB